MSLLVGKSGNGINNNKNTLFLSLSNNTWLPSRSSVSWSRDCVLFLFCLSLSALLFMFFTHLHIKHFPTRALAICTTCESSAAHCFVLPSHVGWWAFYATVFLSIAIVLQLQFRDGKRQSEQNGWCFRVAFAANNCGEKQEISLVFRIVWRAHWGKCFSCENPLHERVSTRTGRWRASFSALKQQFFRRRKIVNKISTEKSLARRNKRAVKSFALQIISRTPSSPQGITKIVYRTSRSRQLTRPVIINLSRISRLVTQLLLTFCCWAPARRG